MKDELPIISFEDFDDKDYDSPYRLVLIASLRSKEIIREAKAQGKILEMKSTELALRELLEENNVGAKPTEEPKQESKITENEVTEK